MKMRPHCFLRPILRPAAVFALAFGVTSLMLSAQDETEPLDTDAAVTEAAEETASDSDEPTVEVDAEAETEDEAEPEEPVLTGDELEVTKAAEADMLENEALFNELLAQGITRTNEKQFVEAFKLFDEAKVELEKCEVSPTRAAFADRLASERKKAQILYGNKILEECEETFNKLLLLSDSKHTDETIVIGQKLLKDLICANVVYYLGIPPAIDEDGNYVIPSYDNADLQVAIANDPVKKKKEQFATTVESMRKATQERIDSQNFWDETSLDAVDPRYNERQREINLLFRAGQFLYQNDQWDEARDKMEQILVKDPYNENAITLLEKIYRRLYAIADVRVYNELLREQAQSDWSWVESIPDVRNIVITGSADPYEAAGNELYNRLNDLMIDHIEFEGSDITSAISLLRARSKDLDPWCSPYSCLSAQLSTADGTESRIIIPSGSFSSGSCPCWSR